VDDDVHVGRALEDVLESRFETLAVTRSADALEVVVARDVAIVVADQRMPGMTGLELLSEVRRLKPTVVGVLITGHADLQDAMEAINAVRVVGFLAKPWDDEQLLAIMERAANAHVALLHLSQASGRAERELRAFETMSSGAPVPVTAQRFGVLPLRDGLPVEFDRLSHVYAEILGLALEQRAFKVDHKISEALHDLAAQLGTLLVGPRDVVDLHVAALKQRMAQATPDEASALAEEGRLLVLELMGHVLTYYRGYRLGVRA
jgi:response regulator RpfG family c-di-GMP phosphodiesterase